MVGGLPIPYKFTKWPDVMNIQLPAKFGFLSTAMLAGISVALARFASLSLPIGTIPTRTDAPPPVARILASLGFQKTSLALPGTVYAFSLPNPRGGASESSPALFAGSLGLGLVERVVLALSVLVTTLGGTVVDAVSVLYVRVILAAVHAGALFALRGINARQRGVPTIPGAKPGDFSLGRGTKNLLTAVFANEWNGHYAPLQL